MERHYGNFLPRSSLRAGSDLVQQVFAAGILLCAVQFLCPKRGRIAGLATKRKTHLHFNLERMIGDVARTLFCKLRERTLKCRAESSVANWRFERVWNSDW